MIDYEKLKLAHEWVCNHFDGQMGIDDLIAKLQELTKPKTKYKVGDEVWMTVDDEPKSFVIDSVCNSKYYLYQYDLGLVYESLLYPTKSALIEAQIEYWQKQLCEIGEHDYPNDSYKCIHCRHDWTLGGQPTFEGEVKGFGEEITSALCCGKVWNYTKTDWSTAKCHLCGSKFVEECQHECNWDGMLVSKSPNMGRCIICKQMCYVAIDHDKWLEEKCEATPIKEYGCKHESDGICYGDLTVKIHEQGQFSIPIPQLKCKKCGEFYR